MLYMAILMIVFGWVIMTAAKKELKDAGKDPESWNDETLKFWGLKRKK